MNQPFLHDTLFKSKIMPIGSIRRHGKYLKMKTAKGWVVVKEDKGDDNIPVGTLRKVHNMTELKTAKGWVMVKEEMPKEASPYLKKLEQYKKNPKKWPNL